MFKVETVTNISASRAADLLCGALEGGSNYWAKYGGKVDPSRDKGRDAYQAVFDLDGRGIYIIDMEDNGARHLLDDSIVGIGLKCMAEKYPKYFQDVVDEHDDAETGDVFLQCCLFGEVKYG